MRKPNDTGLPAIVALTLDALAFLERRARHEARAVALRVAAQRARVRAAALASHGHAR